MKNIRIKDILSTFIYTPKITLCENHGYQIFGNNSFRTYYTANKKIEELEKMFDLYLEWYVVFFEPTNGNLSIVIQKEKFY